MPGRPVRHVRAAGSTADTIGAILAGAAEAATRQSGWVLLAAFLSLDVWIVFGMLMTHLESDPRAPDPMLLLAFSTHGVCMMLTTVWAFHARNLSTMAQVRADEAGRSIGAVWLFLAAYILVGHFQRDRRPVRVGGGGRGAFRSDAQCAGADDGWRLHEVPRSDGRGTANRGWS